MPNMKSISVVIPALNEKDGIEVTIKAIPKVELEKSGYSLQVLVVDGCSDDNTVELAKRAGAEVIIEPLRGYGVAFKTGFDHASGDIIVTADADGTYPMEDICNLVQLLDKENLEFITTNRFAFMQKGAMSFRNKIVNMILNLTTIILFRINLKDCQSGMWVFRKSILDRLVL